MSKILFTRNLLLMLSGVWLLAACTPTEAVPTNLATAKSRVEGGSG